MAPSSPSPQPFRHPVFEASLVSSLSGRLGPWKFCTEEKTAVVLEAKICKYCSHPQLFSFLPNRIQVFCRWQNPVFKGNEHSIAVLLLITNPDGVSRGMSAQLSLLPTLRKCPYSREMPLAMQPIPWPKSLPSDTHTD